MKDFVTERLKLKDLYPERAEALAKEHDIDIEDLELVKKGVVSEKIETVEKERAVISFINMETVDRDNEIIDPDGAILKHYNKTVPYGHDYRGLPMGKSMWIKKATKKGKRGLLAKTIFLKRPAINEELYHMFTDDVAGTGPALNSWSIGFIPLEWEDLERKGDPKEGEADIRPRRKYTKWELLEYSGVMIPSNREALTEMVAKGLIKSEKLKEEIIECIGDECAVEELDNDYDNVVYNSSGLITKPEETDDFIRIPVRDCEVTATITISEKQGITALYCGKIKKIRTYIFNKKPPYNWTMKKAQAWVKEHGKDIKIETIKAYGKELTFVVEGDKTLEFISPKEKETEGTVEIAMKEGADFEEIKDLLNLDEENRQFIEAAGIDKAKYNCECISCGWKHISEKHCNTYKCEKCGGTMRRVGRPGPGQESGEVIELEDKKPIKENVEEEPKQTVGEVTIKIKGDASELEAELEKLRKKYEKIADINWSKFAEEIQPQLIEMIEELREEIKSLKEGRVLSSKNRKLIQDCLASMEAAIPPLKTLLTATEPPQREEFELEVEEQKNPEPDPKLRNPLESPMEIDKDSLTENIASIIKNKIEEMVQGAIKKARGKVE